VAVKPLKHKLAAGEVSIGSWITLAHPGIAEIMARAGFDWLTIDLEHSVITAREAEELIRVINLCGVTPLVRLTSNDADQIKRMMDAGAHGIIVPLVNSRKDAEKALKAMYYPPRGERGTGLARAQGYGATFADYRAWLEKEGVMIAMVEHIDAVNDLESILTTPGVDGYIVGPYDLSSSLGKPGDFANPAHAGAIERIRTVSAKLGKSGGVHVVEPDAEKLRDYIKQGFKFLAYSLDMRMLDVASRKGLEACRK
jgi:2-dehydro-3-deoxyglucarate aldolase